MTKTAIPDKPAELAAFLSAEGIEGVSDLEMQVAATLATIRGFSNPTGQKLFSKPYVCAVKML